MQRKTQRPVQFELTEPTRTAVAAWIVKEGFKSEDFLFSSRVRNSPHVFTRQYARLVEHWVVAAGLDPSAYGTHSKLESTVRYLGTEVDDALEISEQTEI